MPRLPRDAGRRAHRHHEAAVARSIDRARWTFFLKLSHFTRVTRFARAGVDLRIATDYIGHSSTLVHRIYQRLKPAYHGAAIRALASPAGSVENGQTRRIEFHSLTSKMPLKRWIQYLPDGFMLYIVKQTDKGRIMSFSVALIFEDECITRYDTAHGFAHQDVLGRNLF